MHDNAGLGGEEDDRWQPQFPAAVGSFSQFPAAVSSLQSVYVADICCFTPNWIY